MNYPRFLLAFVAVVCVVFIYELLVYGMLFNSLHSAFYGTWLKPQAEVNPLAMFLSILGGALIITLFYALYVQNRDAGVLTGSLFGALLGVIAALLPQLALASVLKDWPFFPHWAIAGWCEHVLAGAVLGLIYTK